MGAAGARGRYVPGRRPWAGGSGQDRRGNFEALFPQSPIGKTLVVDKKMKIKSIIQPGIYLCLLSVLFCLVSCAEMGRDMGIDDVTEVEMRSGLTGSSAKPGVIDPFQKYELVMTANECRYFIVKVPHNWYWKVYITAACRKEAAEGRLSADISPVEPAWASLPGTTFSKSMVLHHDGDQALLAVGNTDQTRYAVLRLCQEGAPVNVSIESQTSSTANLLGPDSDKSALKDKN